jgi:hypothetical protein
MPQRTVNGWLFVNGGDSFFLELPVQSPITAHLSPVIYANKPVEHQFLKGEGENLPSTPIVQNW